jgi:hypothetical protein
MGYMYDLVYPDIYPVAMELFKQGLQRQLVSERIYNKFSSICNLGNNNTIQEIIDCAEYDFKGDQNK